MLDCGGKMRGIVVSLVLAAACGAGDDAMSGSGSSTSTADSGEPLPDPMPQAGHCGYAGDGFACGWAYSDPHACAAGTAVGGACVSPDDEPCCLDDATLVSCDCRDNACDYQWYALDCTHGPGAGACGWDAASTRYVCGGAGEDPGGTPIACPALQPGAPCDDVGLGTTCCDADGNALLCTDQGSNGNAYWATTECATPS